jgi:hypothetical protein
MNFSAWLGMGMIVGAALVAGCGADGGGVFGGSGTTSGSGASGTTEATTGSGGATTSATGSGGATTATSSGVGGSGGGCMELAWFCDDDLDTYGDVNEFMAACEAPPVTDACKGWVSSNNDCGPADPAAYPGQEKYFEVGVIPPISGDKPFDYNCNGAEERNPEQLFKGNGMLACGPQECFFDEPEGFAADAPCGEKQQYFRCATPPGGFECIPTNVDAPVFLSCR